MNCQHDLDQLILFQAGELPEADRTAVEAQVALCGSCQAELGRLRFSSRVDPVINLDPEAVTAARARAYAQIGASWPVQRRRVLQRMGALLAGLRPLPELALGVLLVAVGYGIGARNSPPASVPPSGVVVDIRDITVDETTGVAMITFDRLQESAVTGSLMDASLSRVLSTALVEGPDDGIRLHALKTVSALAGRSDPDPELTRTIVEMVRNEPQEGLRLRAIRALDALYVQRELPASARQALLAALASDAGDGVRIAALDAIMAHEPNRSDAVQLQFVSTNDPNPYVRSGAARTLDRLAVPLEQLQR